MIEMNDEARAFLSEFNHQIPHMSDGGQPDGLLEHPDDKLMAHVADIASNIDRILGNRRNAELPDLPAAGPSGTRPALSARGSESGVRYGAGMTLPVDGGELTLKGVGDLERKGKKAPHSLEAEYRNAVMRAMLRHNPKSRETALELSKRLPFGEVTAGLSRSPMGEREWKVGFNREFGKGGAAKAGFKAGMSAVEDMVSKIGGEGRTSIVPVPNRWFLQPDKFPGQQKLVERVLALSGKERSDFPSGAFINPRTGEIMDGRIMDDVGVVIDPKTNRPMMSAAKEAGVEVLDPKTGSYTKSNLVRKGLFKPEGGDPLLNDLNFLATIEKGDVGHKYGLATEYATPTEMWNTMTGANPTLRPRSRGDLFGMGDVVGRVRVGKSEPHDVYEKLFVAPKGSDVPGVKLSKAKGGLAHLKDGGEPGAAFGVYPQMKAKRAGKSNIGNEIVDTLFVPQDPLDLALMAVPFGKAGRLAAAGIMAAAPGEAEAGKARAGLEAAKKLFGKKTQRQAAPKSVADVFEGVTDPEEAMRIAQAGKHLKIDPVTGKYIGLGTHIDSPQALGALRGRVSDLVKEGAYNADWYLRQKQLARDLAEDPTAQSLFARGTAAYSPQAMPKVELPAFLRQHNEKMLTGQDVMARTQAQMRNVAKAYPESGGLAPENIRLGKKTGPYGNKKDPTVPVDYKTANDIWHARAFELGEPGKVFDRGLTPQEHGVLHGENLLLADRANKAGIPVGTTEGALHDASTAQAATWAAKRFRDVKAEDVARFNKQAKARDVYDRNPEAWKKKNAGKSPPPKPAPLKSDEELRAYASQGLDTAMPNQTAYLTKEAITGVNTGHLAGMPDLPLADKEAYTRQIRDLTGRDPTIEALGMYSKKPVETFGEYKNSLGQIENNPGFQNEVAVSNAPRPGGGRMTPEIEREALDIAAHTDALLGAQEAGAWSRFHPRGTPGLKVADMNALGVNTKGMTPEMRQQFNDFVRSRNLSQMDYGDRVALARFGDEGPVPGIASEEAKAMGKSGLPVEFQRGLAETGYVPAYSRWDEVAINPDTGKPGAMVPTKPGSGEATMQYLDRLNQSKIKDIYSRLDASRWGSIGVAKNEIDQAIAEAKGLPIRQDLLKLRQIINESGFSGLRDYVKKFGPAGLPGMIGYQLSNEQPDLVDVGSTQ